MVARSGTLRVLTPGPPYSIILRRALYGQNAHTSRIMSLRYPGLEASFKIYLTISALVIYTGPRHRDRDIKAPASNAASLFLRRSEYGCPSLSMSYRVCRNAKMHLMAYAFPDAKNTKRTFCRSGMNVTVVIGVFKNPFAVFVVNIGDRQLGFTRGTPLLQIQ